MPKICDPAVVERARVLVEGSARTLGDIAREVGVSLQSVRNWIDRYGWRRYPLAPRAVPKLTPEKEGPARRLYEGGAKVDDLGALISCHPSYVHKLARQRGWAKPGTGAAKAAGSEPSPALQAIIQDLCAPGMTAPASPRSSCARPGSCGPRCSPATIPASRTASMPCPGSASTSTSCPSIRRQSRAASRPRRRRRVTTR